MYVHAMDDKYNASYNYKGMTAEIPFSGQYFLADEP